MPPVSPPTAPVRTCLGCRKRDGQAVLVRLIAEGDRVVADLARRGHGRGAWVHRDRRCVGRLALGAVERGLRAKLAPDALAGLGAAIGSVTGHGGQDQVQPAPAKAAPGHGTPER